MDGGRCVCVCVCVCVCGRSFRAVLTSNNTTAFVLVSVNFNFILKRTSDNQCVVVFMYGIRLFKEKKLSPKFKRFVAPSAQTKYVVSLALK